MDIRVAQIWDEYVLAGFMEVPLRISHFAPEIKSVTLARILWDNGKAPCGSVFARKVFPVAGLTSRSFLFRARDFLERRVLPGGFVRFARKKIESHGANIVHFHFGFSAAHYPDLPGNLPFIVTFYGSDVSAALKSTYWAGRYRKVLPNAAALLVLCEEVKERLAALGCSRERIHVWNLPAGVEQYPLLTPKPGKVPRLITSARFVEKKGHGILLDAYELLCREGIEFSATLLGYGPDKALIEEGIKARRLDGKVKVIDTAFKGDFAALHYSELKSHDIFVLPSIRAANGDDEGGPALTMVCAQAAGLPVVCTRFPGSEITMRDGETGFYAEPDAKELADSIRRLLGRPQDWAKMGAAGSRLANENFGERSQLEKLVELYRGICPKTTA